MGRFTLDEEKAAGWIAAGMDNFETGAESGRLEINPNYWPTREDGGDTYALVSEAMTDGILAGPGELHFDYQTDGDGDGYTWLLYVDGAPGHPLKLASKYERMGFLGAGDDVSGADAALAVLREAAAAGNRLLDDLAAYVAQESGDDGRQEGDWLEGKAQR